MTTRMRTKMTARMSRQVQKDKDQGPAWWDLVEAWKRKTWRRPAACDQSEHNWILTFKISSYNSSSNSLIFFSSHLSWEELACAKTLPWRSHLIWPFSQDIILWTFSQLKRKYFLWSLFSTKNYFLLTSSLEPLRPSFEPPSSTTPTTRLTWSYWSPQWQLQW